MVKGKVTIITGSASGIGLDTANVFAQNGAKVVLSSLWSISDDGTEAFMNIFYKHYLINPNLFLHFLLFYLFYLN